MEKISSNINLLFKKLFFTTEFKHPFIEDLDRVKEIDKGYKKHQKRFIKEKIEYDPELEVPPSLELKNIRLKEPFDLKVLKKLSSELDKTNNFETICNLVNKLYNQDIPSNVKKINLSEYRKSNRINVAIIGSGPIGLFLACYLFKFYNTSYGLNDQPKINIVIFDNKIVESGIRKPYLRKRPFAFGSTFFSYIIPNIYTWSNDKNGLLISIYILEYILFTKAYFDFEIPFLFDKYSWEDYCKIIKNGNFKVVFDCTGGRLNPPIFNDINISWVQKLLKKNKSYNFEILKNKNLVKLKTDLDEFTYNFYYGCLYIYKVKNNKINYIDKIDLDIRNFHDLKLFIRLKDKYFDYNDIILICKNIKSNFERNLMYNIIINRYSEKDLVYQFDLFNTYLRHSIEISKTIEYKNHKFLYIGSGDTIFHSHFIVGAGMNRTITFAVKCANFITSLEDD